MSLLIRAKSYAGNRLFSAQSITALHQSNVYSTRTADSTSKTQQSTNPRTQKSSEPSNFSQRIKTQTGFSTVWPKPKEIPYQAKVSNFVNLIGHVKAPVEFESSSDGKHYATTVISQANIGVKNSLLIPVVFEGDLAHVVACHVKENDCVFVSGRLSVDPVRFSLGDSLGKFHVVVENLNFVEGLRRNVNVSAKKKLEFVKAVDTENEEATKSLGDDEDFNQQWSEALEHAKVKKFANDDQAMNASSESPFADAAAANLESKPEKVNEKSVEGDSKKKDGDKTMGLWRDLMINPLKWWDYRGHKSNGLVKEKFPDFKHKETGEPLWVNTAPDWVLPGIAKVQFDVKFMKAKPVQESGEVKNDGKGEDVWKNLVENPNKWWDNRVKKYNPKAPDFKHKETGEGLWVSDSPDWALSRLPPLRNGQKL